jgi:hypothetical protein
MDLHERLVAARVHAGFGSATEAAEALGVKYGTYSGHENGSSGFRADKGELYARRFKVRFEWLMRGTGPMVESAQLADLASKYRELLTIYDSLPSDLQAHYAEILRKLGEPYQQPEPDQVRSPAKAKST